MGLFDAIGKIVGSASSQVNPTKTSFSVDKKSIYFSKNFHEIAKQRGLTESDARDVYQHGSSINPNMLVRKYNGYEIGIYYFISPDTGQPVITSI